MKQPIPWSFLRKWTRLSWREAAVGYHNHWLDWASAVDLACDCLAEGQDDALVVELASISGPDAHAVGELLDKLASVSSEVVATSPNEKWLYLILLWLYECRQSVDDPLEEVEGIYADFDYPEDVAPFVRYMPPTDGYDPSSHSVAENQARLYENWKGYLERMAKKFQVKELSHE